jgi:hypothetical protein
MALWLWCCGPLLMAGGKDMSLPVFIPLNVVILFISVSTPYLQGIVSDALGDGKVGSTMVSWTLIPHRRFLSFVLILDCIKKVSMFWSRFVSSSFFAFSCQRGSHGRLACLRLPRKQLQHGLCA